MVKKRDTSSTKQNAAPTVSLREPVITNLAACVEDARIAALDSDNGPADAVDYSSLLGRMVAAKTRLPPLYTDVVYEPFVAVLTELGHDGFVQLLLNDPERQRDAGLILDVAHAILQNGEGYEEQATDAFQEVVSDVYDGFLSMEDRLGVNPPDHSTIAPLVKWGNPDFGPYTWPISATQSLGLGTGIVSLPPANSRRGLLAWSVLGHETAGHDVLHADAGLAQEIAVSVFNALDAATVGNVLPAYWAARIDEAASDVLGILNTGPTAGMGLIGYFRGLNGAFTGVAKLRSVGPAGDVHPADVLRGFLASAVVRHLEFRESSQWADVILQETKSDVETILIAGQTISLSKAQKSAEIVAETIAGMRLTSVENHSLCEIQNWRDGDEEIVLQLRGLMTRAANLPQSLEAGMYAAHAIAAGVTAAFADDGPLPVIFDRMKSLLKMMHDANPSWGPLFVVRPGDLTMHPTYQRHQTGA